MWKLKTYIQNKGVSNEISTIVVERKRDLRLDKYQKLDKDVYIRELSDGRMIILKFEETEPIYRVEWKLMVSLKPEEREYLKNVKKVMRLKRITTFDRRKSLQNGRKKKKGRNRSKMWKRKVPTYMELEIIKKTIMKLAEDGLVADDVIDDIVRGLKKLWKYDKESFWEVMMVLGVRAKDYADLIFDDFLRTFRWFMGRAERYIFMENMRNAYERRLFYYENTEMDSITLAGLFPEHERETEWNEYVYGGVKL